MGYVSHAQRKAVWASKKDGGKGNPNKKGSPAKKKDKFVLEYNRKDAEIRSIKNNDIVINITKIP